MKKYIIKKIILLVFTFIGLVSVGLFISYKYNTYLIDQVIINFSISDQNTEKQYLSSKYNGQYTPVPKPNNIAEIEGSVFDTIPIFSSDGAKASRYAGGNVVFMLIKENGEWKIYGWRRLK